MAADSTEARLGMPGRGFSLLELLACLLVVALLAGLAAPGFRAAWLHARRSEAVGLLLRMQLAEERFHFDHGRYAATLPELEAVTGSVSGAGGYRVAASSAAADQYRLEATATGPQAGDRPECLVLAVNQRGERSPPEPSGCWR